MEVIKDTIAQFMQRLQSKKETASKDNPEIVLKKLLSKKELKHIKINYFKKGTIGISVDSSTWLYYLSLQKERLLEELHKASPLIKDIRFKIGDIAEKA
jgi:hypothetical protein